MICNPQQIKRLISIASCRCSSVALYYSNKDALRMVVHRPTVSLPTLYHRSFPTKLIKFSSNISISMNTGPGTMWRYNCYSGKIAASVSRLDCLGLGVQVTPRSFALVITIQTMLYRTAN